MANQVDNLIYVRKAHNNALQALENIFETIGDNSLAFSDILPEWDECDRYPSAEWTEANIGSRFATLDEFECDISNGIVNIEISSEWTPIRNFFIRLCHILEEIDEDVELGMLYTDEFRQFDGHLIYAQGDLVVDQHHVAELVKLDSNDG